MIEYITYLSAQRIVADRAQEALPSAPRQESAIGRRFAPRLRLGISQALRGLADWIAPAPAAGGTTCDVASPA